jgi:CHAD domain-containing protein
MDSVAPILGPEYSELAASLRAASDSLRDEQDSAISVEWLRDMSASAPGAIGFCLGALASKISRGDAAPRSAFTEEWPSMDRHARSLKLVRR